MTAICETSCYRVQLVLQALLICTAAVHSLSWQDPIQLCSYCWWQPSQLHTLDRNSLLSVVVLEKPNCTVTPGSQLFGTSVSTQNC